MSKEMKIVNVLRGSNDFVGYELVKLSEYRQVEGERLLTHGFVMDVLRKVMGKTLTIIDATITEKQQNKAVKDILRGVISDEMGFTSDWAFDQHLLQQDIPEDLNEVSSISVEEALGVN